MTELCPLTVVTATYNVVRASGAAALERCLRSVGALSFVHEHLVIDGASTDGTREVVRRLADEIPALTVSSSADRGIYDALNRGLAAARGQYVYFLGADDCLTDPAALTAAVECCLREGLDVFVAPTRFSNGRLFPRRRAALAEMASHMAYSHQGCLARTELLRGLGGFDISCRCMADYKLMLRAHLAGATVGIGERPFAMYDVGGTSSRPSSEREDEDDRIKRDVYALTEAELAAYRASSRLPFRCCREMLRSSSAFTRAMGRRLLMTYLWRKHKTDRVSSRYLFGVRVFSHPLKALRRKMI